MTTIAMNDTGYRTGMLTSSATASMTVGAGGSLLVRQPGGGPRVRVSPARQDLAELIASGQVMDHSVFPQAHEDRINLEVVQPLLAHYRVCGAAIALPPELRSTARACLRAALEAAGQKHDGATVDAYLEALARTAEKAIRQEKEQAIETAMHRARAGLSARPAEQRVLARACSLMARVDLVLGRAC